MKSTLQIFLIVLSYFAPPLIYANDTIAVRVAAYNVKTGSSAYPEQIGQMFKPYKLDIVGFSEAPDGDWTARVGEVLGMKYSYVGSVSSAHHYEKYKTILSRTPLTNTNEFILEAKRGWSPASSVKAETTIRGVPVSFHSLHIAASEGKPEGHANLFATEVLPLEKNKRIIVVGDFNNEIKDPAMQIILDTGMKHIWADLKIDLSTATTKAKLGSKGVIDHILYSNSSSAKVINGGIIDLAIPLSDHHPIWAEITFPMNNE